MSTPATDVSTAQSFDVGSFLNNVVSTAGNVIAARTAPTQNTGQPSVSTSPSQTLTPSGAAAGITSPNLYVLGIGAAVLIGAILILRSK